MDTGLSIGILVAFLGGMVSFASPCCLPLVPAYVGYMVGSQPDDGTARRRAAFSQALAFVLGFSAVFIALWASVGLIGYVLRDYVMMLRQVGGAILVFMGLHVAGVINVTALYREVHLPVGAMGGASMGFGQAAPSTPSHRRSALLGVVFAAGLFWIILDLFEADDDALGDVVPVFVVDTAKYDRKPRGPAGGTRYRRRHAQRPI